MTALTYSGYKMDAVRLEAQRWVAKFATQEGLCMCVCVSVDTDMHKSKQNYSAGYVLTMHLYFRQNTTSSECVTQDVWAQI